MPLWDQLEKPLAKLLFHQSYSVRGVCAITARSLATALPDQLAKLLSAYLNVTNMEYAELASCKPNQLKLVGSPFIDNDNQHISSKEINKPSL